MYHRYHISPFIIKMKKYFVVTCHFYQQNWTLWNIFANITPKTLSLAFSKLTFIGLVIGLSPGRRQAIVWTNTGILLIRLLRDLHWNINRYSHIFIQDNLFENVVGEMASIIPRPQYVNRLPRITLPYPPVSCYRDGIVLWIVKSLLWLLISSFWLFLSCKSRS